MSDTPDFVAPGAPVEAVWGNDVVTALRDVLEQARRLTPIGAVMPYGGDVEPENYLFCRGGAYSISLYSELYAVIGTKYNNGQPTTPAGSFRVPNLQARFPVGHNKTGETGGAGSYWTVGPGEIAGSYTPVMPAHVHAVPDHLHGLGGTTGGQDRDHAHNSVDGSAFTHEGFGPYQIPLHYLPVGSGTDIGGPHYFHFQPTTGGGGDHLHVLPATTGAADRSLTSAPAGGGTDIPPGVAFNFIIRAR